MKMATLNCQWVMETKAALKIRPSLTMGATALTMRFLMWLAAIFSMFPMVLAAMREEGSVAASMRREMAATWGTMNTFTTSGPSSCKFDIPIQSCVTDQGFCDRFWWFVGE